APSENAGGDEDEGGVLVSIRQLAAAAVLDGDAEDIDSAEGLPPCFLLIAQADDLHPHASLEKRLRSTTRPGIPRKVRKGHHSYSLTLKPKVAGWGGRVRIRNSIRCFARYWRNDRIRTHTTWHPRPPIPSPNLFSCDGFNRFLMLSLPLDLHLVGSMNRFEE